MSVRRRRLPVLAVFEMKTNGQVTKLELDEDCLNRLSYRIYGSYDMATEKTLGLLIHGFIGQFIDCNKPTIDDQKDAAYQIGRKLGTS